MHAVQIIEFIQIWTPPHSFWSARPTRFSRSTSHVNSRRFLGFLCGLRPWFSSPELIILFPLTFLIILNIYSWQSPFYLGLHFSTLHSTLRYIYQQAPAYSSIKMMKRQQLAIALAVLALSNYGKPHFVFLSHSLTNPRFNMWRHMWACSRAETTSAGLLALALPCIIWVYLKAMRFIAYNTCIHS